MRTICSARASAHRLPLLAAVLVSVLLGVTPTAQALTITFDNLGLVPGEIITGAPGVAIVADNFARSFDYAAMIDTAGWGQGTVTPKDPSPWIGGNLVGQELGLALILQNNSTGCDDGVCDLPDDEGAQPAGTLSFLFDTPVTSIGFDLIDIAPAKGEQGWVTFRDVGGASVTVDFTTLLAGLQTGNSTANRIAPLFAASLGLGPLDEVRFRLGGSAAIDNVTFVPIPEPATALFLGLGLALLGTTQRHPRRHGGA